MIRKYYSSKVTKAFNSWANRYEEEVVPKLIKRGYSYPQLAEHIVNELGIHEDEVILELGVGTGVLGREVKKKSNATIIGLDISREMLNEAAQKNMYKYLINSSAEGISLSDHSFNSIYTAFMFHSVLNQKRALEEVGRLLKKDGRAVIVDLFPLNGTSALKGFVRGYFHSLKYEYGAPANYKTIESVKSMITKLGFEIVNNGQLGADKNYIHYYFTIKKGDHYELIGSGA